MQLRRLLRTVVAVAALALAASAALPPASAGETGQRPDAMTVAMAPDGDMAGCATCEPSDLGAASPTCAPACAAAAVLPTGVSTQHLSAASNRSWSAAARLAGADARPEPHPPKATILV